MKFCQFVLLCEGSSDSALIPALETILLNRGIDEAYGTSYSRTGSVADKLRWLKDEDIFPDLVFIHRDADRVGVAVREREIQDAVNEFCEREEGASSADYLPLVPISMTEAWALVSETNIRNVCGNPSGRDDLDLPKVHEIENLRDPKEVLFEALRRACGGTGRRRPTIQKLTTWRMNVLNRLDVNGPVTLLPAWQKAIANISGWYENKYPYENRS